jgi:hypothetical protein
VGSRRERWRWYLNLAHKALSLDCPRSRRWWWRGTRSCLFLLRCTSLVVLWHLCLVAASVCMIVVRLFTSLC